MTEEAPQKQAALQRIIFVLFAVLAATWIGWVIYAFQGSAPGLVDDGIHIRSAETFEQNGIIPGLWKDLTGVFSNGDRFYETQFAYLGACWFLFHQHLSGWYAANLFLNVLCAAFAAFFVYRAFRDRVAAAVSAAIIMTSSPVAETIRGGFGKVEDLMAALFLGGVCVWRCCVYRGKSWVWMAVAGLLVTLGCASKESGKLLAASLIAPCLLTYLFNRDAARRLHTLAMLGVSGIIANYAVFYPSTHSKYIANYFALDFSLPKISQAALFYVRETPDFALLLAAVLVGYVFILANRWKALRAPGNASETEHVDLAIGLACLFIGSGYMAALLGFRFSLMYYEYIPLAIVALSAGIAVALLNRISAKAALALLAIFFVTRIYGVGYMFCATGAQRLIDETNFAAFSRSEKLGTQRVFELDVSDDSETIEEWNTLREALNKASVPLLYGSSDFKAWTFNDNFRRFPSGSAGDSSISINEARWYENFPTTGDFVALRFGRIKLGNHFLRSGVPFEQSPEGPLANLDKSALSKPNTVKRTMRIYDPNIFRTTPATYGWKFYRLDRPIAYRIAGRATDFWMKPDCGVEVFDTAYVKRLYLKIEVPGGLPAFPLHISARAGNTELSSVTFEGPGVKTFEVPLDAKGWIQLQADQWIAPSPRDPRPLSFRVLDCSTSPNQN